MSAWDVIRHEYEVRPHPLVPALAGVPDARADRHAGGTGQLASSIVYGRQRRSWTLPRGGSGALTDALVRFIEDHGGAVLCDRPVARLVIEDGRCAGVETEDGERFLGCEAVVSTIHVKHLLDMAPGRRVADEGFRYGVETFDVGLSGVRRPPGDDRGARVRDRGRAAQRGVRRAQPAGRRTSSTTSARCATTATSTTSRGCSSRPDARRSVARARGPPHGEAPQRPAVARRARGMDRRAQGAAGRAPARARPRRRAEPHGRRDPRVARQEPRGHRGAEPPHDPRDVPRRRPHATRRAAGCAPRRGGRQYRMPIPGLYQTGGTTHPGGSITGAPGRNAAIVLLSGSRTRPRGGGGAVPDARVQSAIDHWAPRFATNGVDHNDFRTTTARIERWDEWLDAWSRDGRGAPRARRGRARRGPRASRPGRRSLRAAVCFHFAKFVWVRRRGAQPRDDGARRSTRWRPRTRCSTRRPSAIEAPLDGGARRRQPAPAARRGQAAARAC